MKTKLSATLLYCLMCTALMAQSTWGVKGGVNYTGHSISNIPEQVKDLYDARGKGHVGFHLGLFVRFGGAFHVQPELLYSRLQGNVEVEDLKKLEREEINVSLNRIDIPLLLGFRFLRLLRIQAGTVASFNAGSYISSDLFRDIDVNAAALGYQIGLGVDILMLSFDLRYEGPFKKQEVIFTGNPSGGEDLLFDNRSDQLILSLAWNF